MVLFQCGFGHSGPDIFEKIINTCPSNILAFLGSPAQDDSQTFNFGSGYTKGLALVSYYGPGAVQGATINGTLRARLWFSGSYRDVYMTKISTVRDDARARALEYWECEIDPTLNLSGVEFYASNYEYNNGTRINANLWLLK